MFKTTKATALFLFFLIFAGCYSQQSPLDSLKSLLQNPKIHDTTKLYKIANMKSGFNDYERESLYLNSLMGNLAFKNYNKQNTAELHKKYTMYLAAYYNNLGNKFTKQRDVINSLTSLDKSFSLFKMAGAYDEMNYVLVSKSVFFSKINEYEKAISCLFDALKYFEKNRKENGDGISYVHSSLAVVYSDQDKHEKSIEYNTKVIDYFDALPSPTDEDEYMQSLAYSNCGSSYFSIKKYSEAMSSFNKALALSRKISSHSSSSIILSKMARVKIEQSKFDEGESLLKQALTGDINEVAMANAYVKLGELYFKKKDFAKADFYLSKGLEDSKKIRILELQEQASELLFKVSKANKDFAKALVMHEFHDMLLDSSKTETSRNILAQQQLKYNFDKKEMNYKLATEKKNASKNNLLIGLSSSFLLFLLGGYYYYRNNKQKQAIAILEKNQIKQKLLITQMNPHFIFNSIDNIQSLIYNKQDKDALNYLTKFSKLTRQILENSTENYISLTEEVEMTRNYVAIQQLLYNNKFVFTISVSAAIDTDSILLPPMLTQPFIENAIKHGLSNKAEDGKVEIGFYFQHEKLCFEVADNGHGFDDAKRTDQHKSMAMAITRERLIYYTKNQDFVVQANNLKDADNKVIGAKVVFEIPYIYEN